MSIVFYFFCFQARIPLKLKMTMRTCKSGWQTQKAQTCKVYVFVSVTFAHACMSCHSLSLSLHSRGKDVRPLRLASADTSWPKTADYVQADAIQPEFNACELWQARQLANATHALRCKLFNLEFTGARNVWSMCMCVCVFFLSSLLLHQRKTKATISHWHGA